MVDVGLALAAYRYGLTAQVGWLGLKVGGCLAQPCIRQMNQVYGTLESVVSMLQHHRNCCCCCDNTAIRSR